MKAVQVAAGGSERSRLGGALVGRGGQADWDIGGGGGKMVGDGLRLLVVMLHEAGGGG